MVKTRHVVNLAENERIVKRYHVAKKPAFPEIDRYLTVTNQRVIMETRVQGLLYGVEVYDEAHLDVIRGSTVGYEKRYLLSMIVPGIAFLLFGLFAIILALLLASDSYSSSGSMFCVMGSIPLILLGIVFLVYSKRESFYLKLKMQHIGDIDFGVLKKGLALLSLRPGRDADAVIIEVGALIKTLQKDPNFSLRPVWQNQKRRPQYRGPQYNEDDRAVY